MYFWSNRLDNRLIGELRQTVKPTQPSRILRPRIPEQAELPFGRAADWRTIPSTKVRRPAADAPFSWAHTYTAFSLEFAVAALRQLGAKPGATVFDPFGGSGTTALAAAINDCNSISVDVSPFAALLARCRLSKAVKIDRLSAYLDVEADTALKVPDTNVIAQADHAYARTVVEHISQKRKIPAFKLLSNILKDSTGALDTEAVAVLSLALAAKETSLLEKGTNPIWYKPTSDTSQRKRNLRKISKRIGVQVAQDIMDAGQSLRKTHRVKNADIASLRASPKFDICLTSPPYLNRLDYVVAHLPELSILQLVSPFQIEDLKRSMIGTTKIVKKYGRSAPSYWGRHCLETLDAIGDHRSYASASYYYHNFYNYFERLFEALRITRQLMRTKARGLIVVQDSYYKDVLIQTPLICTEMMRSLSCESSIVRSTPVRTHMGRMSPKQNEYAPQKTLNEALVYFESVR